MKISKSAGFFKFPVLVVVLLNVLFCFNVRAAVSQHEYDSLIQTTRGDELPGQLGFVIDQLKAWQRTDPHNQRIIYDLAALLDRAGDYPAVESYYQPVMQADAPAYAIHAVAHAALKNKHFQQAETAYQLLVRKTPDDVNAHVGLVYAWMGQGHIEQAFNYVQQRLQESAKPYSAKEAPMLIALAELYEERKAWLQAASVYQKVVQLNPESHYARRGLVFALRQAGMPHLAKHYADSAPAAFTGDEKYSLALGDAAQTIRFGEAQLDASSKASRFNTMDIALAENTELTEQFGEIPTTKFDRIVALYERGEMRQAVQLYQSLTGAGIAVPTYAKLAVAGAYLFLEQPETARDLYLEGLKNFGDNNPEILLDTQISLMYAYSEAGQYKEAEALADQMVAAQSKMLYKDLPGLEQANPDYVRADVVRARLWITNDRLDRAENHLKALRAQAPFNNDIRLAWAELQMARDHPRLGLEEFSLMSVDHPESVDATVGRGEALLSLNEFAQAKVLLPPLPDTHPENKAVETYAERLENYGQPFFKIESMFGQGAVNNGADSLVDARLYSAPLTNLLNDHVRVFSHLVFAEGKTADNETASRSRLGVGMDYRAHDIDAEAEINHTLNDPNSNGVALALGWNLSDAWYAQAGLDTNTVNLPAAALAEDITAKEAQLNLTWSKNESRKVGGGLSTLHFSDDNVRNMANLWWLERWISHPVFKLETLLYLATSTNSETNRPYFNPARDKEINLATRAEWLTWRRYRRSFKQRAEIMGGQYWQSDFASGAMAGARYEHQWEFENELAITYGVGRSFQPYDGVREYRNYIYLNLSGRIK